MITNKNTTEDIHEENDITSTQNMIKEARLRRELKGKQNNSKRIHCNICEKRFNKEHTFKHHMKVIHKEEDTEVEILSQISNSKSKSKLIMNNNKSKEMTFQENKRSLRSKKNESSAASTTAHNENITLASSVETAAAATGSQDQKITEG